MHKLINSRKLLYMISQIKQKKITSIEKYTYFALEYPDYAIKKYFIKNFSIIYLINIFKHSII